MSSITTMDRIGTQRELIEYTTLELVSVLAHAESSRRQMDRFVEKVTAELTRRYKVRSRPANIAFQLSRRWRQRGSPLIKPGVDGSDGDQASVGLPITSAIGA